MSGNGDGINIHDFFEVVDLWDDPNCEGIPSVVAARCAAEKCWPESAHVDGCARGATPSD